MNVHRDILEKWYRERRLDYSKLLVELEESKISDKQRTTLIKLVQDDIDNLLGELNPEIYGGQSWEDDIRFICMKALNKYSVKNLKALSDKEVGEEIKKMIHSKDFIDSYIASQKDKDDSQRQN